MINKVSIKNFKSIFEIKDVKVGRVNLLIGENGSGKSSILPPAVPSPTTGH